MEIKTKLWNKTRKAAEALKRRLKSKAVKENTVAGALFAMWCMSQLGVLYIVVSWFI